MDMRIEINSSDKYNDILLKEDVTVYLTLYGNG